MKTVNLTEISHFTTTISQYSHINFTGIMFLVLILLIFLSIVSGFGTAFYYLTNEPNKKIVFNRKIKQIRFDKFQEIPEKALIDLKVLGVLISLGFILSCSYLIDNLFVISNQGIENIFPIKIIVISCLIIVFGIYMPKAIATKRPQKVALLFINFIYLANYIIYPFSFIYQQVESILRKKIANKKPDISLDNLSNALDITNHDIKDNKKILKGIVSYGSTDASEIMKPRVDIVAFNISTPFSELLMKIRKQNYSRIPVFSETLDNIKGVLFVKDLLPHFHKPSFSWQSLIRPAYFVPQSKKINDLLLDFQTKKIHMSIVIDEYGGTCGIVTLEDVLEEIVGEIVDEFYKEDEFYKKVDENSYIFEGKTFINDFYKIMNLEDDFFDEIRGDAETMAGLILEMNGEMPKNASVFNFKNYIFKIIAADKRRIKQIHVTLQNTLE